MPLIGITKLNPMYIYVVPLISTKYFILMKNRNSTEVLHFAPLFKGFINIKNVLNLQVCRVRLSTHRSTGETGCIREYETKPARLVLFSQD
jgi:hypothetical protein